MNKKNAFIVVLPLLRKTGIKMELNSTNAMLAAETF
jgi:hypothetical protein